MGSEDYEPLEVELTVIGYKETITEALQTTIESIQNVKGKLDLKLILKELS